MRIERPARAWLGLVLAWALAFVSGGCGAGGSPTAPLPASPIAVAPTPAPSPKVAILSVDGLRADAFASVELPNLWGLALRGAYTRNARTVMPSNTLPAHASMLSGQDPAVHRLTWDDYRPDQGHIGVPTVFSVAKAAGLHTAMVVGKKKLQHLAAPGSVDTFTLTERGDKDVANEAIVQAAAGFDLLFVHFPDVDLTGHAEGWMSAAYMAKLSELDETLGRLLAGLPPQTTVIVTSDHGGKDRHHGRDIPEDTTVPWIISGPRVVRRGALTCPVKEADTAATALWLLGLRLPAGCAGQVVSDPFTAP
jgi:predicted AlkP superfamily pyrophosphatase or phosphodiesterase